MEKFTIALDVMGSDRGPAELIAGAKQAIAEFSNLKLVLVGDEAIITQELGQKYDTSRYEILHASEVIGYDEQPTVAIKQKKNSSLTVGLKHLKAGTVQGFVSAGSTGALLVGVFAYVKRKPGIARPALCALLPSKTGFTLLLDCGANAEVKPEYLLQFGELGAQYMRDCMGVQNPRVGLINVGTEKEKGTPTLQEANILLSESKINFIGNIEGRDIPSGVVDVAVCDGLVGNVVLKLTEGLSKTLMGMIRDELKSGIISFAGAILAKGAFARLKKRFDYKEIGGAPFLGLESLVVKAHGSSDAKCIKNAIKQCMQYASATK